MQSTKKKDIGQLALRTEVIDRIKKDGELFIKVAKVLDVSHFSLPRLLNTNHKKLTQVSVIRLLKKELKIGDENRIVEALKEPL